MKRLLAELEASYSRPARRLDEGRPQVGAATWLHAPWGVVVRCQLEIDPQTRLITDAVFTAALCPLAQGYGLVLARALVGRREDAVDEALFSEVLSPYEVPADKEHCHLPVANACLGALQSWDAKQQGGDGVLREPRGGLAELVEAAVVFGWFLPSDLEQALTRVEANDEAQADARALFPEGDARAKSFLHHRALLTCLHHAASFDVLDPAFRRWLVEWGTTWFEGPIATALLEPVFVVRAQLGRALPAAQPKLVEFGEDAPATWEVVVVEGLRSLQTLEPTLPAGARLVMVASPQRKNQSGLIVPSAPRSL